MKRKNQKGIELKSEIRFLTTPFKVILRHILCSLVWVADVRGQGGGGGGLGGGEGRRFPAREKREGRTKGGKGAPPNSPFARALTCPNSLSLRKIATQSIVLLRIFLFTHIMAWRSTVRAVAAENKQTKGKTWRTVCDPTEYSPGEQVTVWLVSVYGQASPAGHGVQTVWLPTE